MRAFLRVKADDSIAVGAFAQVCDVLNVSCALLQCRHGNTDSLIDDQRIRRPRSLRYAIGEENFLTTQGLWCAPICPAFFDPASQCLPVFLRLFRSDPKLASNPSFV